MINKSLLKALKRALIASRQLVNKKYDKYDHPLSGMCYFASEALYHLGAKELGFKPKRFKYKGVSHWWLENESGEVIDLTKEQFPFKFPYKCGKFTAFLTKTPSKRAQIVIKNVLG